MNEARQLRLIEPELPDTVGPLILSVAIVGLALGYLYFTEQGRQARQRLERLVDTLASDLDRFREAAHRLAGTSLDSLDAVEQRIVEFSRLVRR